MRNHFLLVFILTIFISSCGPRYTIRPDYDFSRVKRIAILDFVGAETSIFSAESVAGYSVADEFVLQLVGRGYDVVERSQLKAIVKEQYLGASGILDPGTVKEIGKIVGADVIITGTIAEYTPNRRDVLYVDDGFGGRRQELYFVDAEIALSVRMIDVENGIVVWAGFYRYNSFYIESAIAGAVSGLLRSLDKVLPPVSSAQKNIRRY